MTFSLTGFTSVKRENIEVSGGGQEAVTATAEKPGEFTLENVPEKRVADSYKVSRLASPNRVAVSIFEFSISS